MSNLSSDVTTKQQEESLTIEDQQLQQQSLSTTKQGNTMILLDSQSTIDGDIVYEENNCHPSNKKEENEINKNDTNVVDVENMNDEDVHYIVHGSSESSSRHTHHRSLSGLLSEFASISGYTKQNQPQSQVKSQQLSTKSETEDYSTDSAIGYSYPSQQLTSTIIDNNINNSHQSLPTSGKKHRRIHSGGISNPSMAHRRINSRGNAAFIDRHFPSDFGPNATDEPHHVTSSTSYNNSNMTSSSNQQQYNNNQQQYQHRPRSLSPRPSPKHYLKEDVTRPHHCRDDSGIDNLFDTSRSNHYRNDFMEGDVNYNPNKWMSNSDKSKDDGTSEYAAQWLRNMRRSSPPLELSQNEYINAAKTHLFRSKDNPRGNIAHPPPRYSGYTIEERYPSQSAHMQEYPIQYHQQQQQQHPYYGSQYDQHARSGPASIPHKELSYYPPRRGPQSSTRISASSHNYPVQKVNYRHSYPPHHFSQSSNSSVAAARAAEAARASTLGVLQHPLADEVSQHRPRPVRRGISTTSVESKIETDEPLFQKDAMASQRRYPPRPTTTQSYRVSPQLFQESLKEFTCEGESPNSLTYSSTYQDTLLSSLVNHNPDQHQPEMGNDATFHHRKTSSSAIFNAFVRDIEKRQYKKDSHSLDHHRSDSTGSLLFDNSMLHGEKFLASTTTPAMSPTTSQIETDIKSQSRRKGPPTSIKVEEKKTEITSIVSPSPATNRTITGGVSKRIRRKCSVPECTNRVVQGGLCISHGAKRKICGHPGCTKHVKKAGMCSTHGPARKRCEVDGCQKVAVQGGRCIAHGAKKKLCSFRKCTKQAILSGMCKKHHDMEKLGNDNVSNQPTDHQSRQYCVPINKRNVSFTKENEGNSPHDNSSEPSTQHRRGLSIFQDMNTVNSIIGSTEQSSNYLTVHPSPTSNREGFRAQGHGGHNRGLSIFADEEVVDKIVHNEFGL